MVYFSERLSSQAQRTAADDSVLNRITDMVVVNLCKKVYQDRLAYVKKWEREKIVNLGLTETMLPYAPIPDNKNFCSSAWEREKVRQFGLIGAGSHKTIYREDPYYQQEQRENQFLRKTLALGKHFFATVSEQISTARENDEDDALFAAEPPPLPETETYTKGKATDKFLKTLGY
jgi:hypothetical protein